MSEDANVGATEEAVTAAQNAATELVKTVFKSLSDLPTAADPAQRWFFPHGIEVIYLKVDAYFNEKIHGTAVIEIAGDKTIPPTAALSSVQE